MDTDTITLIVFISFWPFWGIWELYLLKLRSDGRPVKTISMIAHVAGSRSSALVFLWEGLSTHFWWPGSSWASVPGAVLFWVIALLLFGEDLLLALSIIDAPVDPQDLRLFFRIQRNPLVLMVAGALAGHFLFPQRG